MRSTCSAITCGALAQPEHDPCCSSHGKPLCCRHYNRFHFVEVNQCTPATHAPQVEPRKGVTINGGKAHVRAPGLRPKTRCGRPLRAVNQIAEVPDVDQLPPADRCAQCFPGSRA